MGKLKNVSVRVGLHTAVFVDGLSPREMTFFVRENWTKMVKLAINCTKR